MQYRSSRHPRHRQHFGRQHHGLIRGPRRERGEEERDLQREPHQGTVRGGGPGDRQRPPPLEAPQREQQQLHQQQ